MTGDELKREYAAAESWQRDALVWGAAFQLDLLHAQLEHKDNMLRMAQECGQAWRSLYHDSWRSAMRTWVNDKPLYDEEMDKQHREQERRDLVERHCPTFELENQNGVDESVG